MARTPLIAGNYKLNLGPEPAAALVSALAPRISNRGDVDVAVFPTALAIPAVVSAAEGSGILVGIQEVHHEASGAFTGTNSPEMARAAGCQFALIGHSERRQLFGETDTGVSRKVVATLRAGLLPMVCVGETLEQRDADQVEAVITRQLAAALGTLTPDQVATVTLAYEPVWAIGTGRTASPTEAQEAHATLRAWLRDHYPTYVSEQVRILYGGSVKPHNAESLLAGVDVDGALVGGASLSDESFAAIVGAAAS